MFLKALKILSGDAVIREIPFHKGINLIVDETPTTISRTTSGNNVGKTTVLRLVDYCFGGDGKNIYQDMEFDKQPNTFVERFLKENDIIIEIRLVADINNPASENIVIRRNFQQRTKKIQEINGENITNNTDFDKRLKELIFKTTVDKPTLREIISKNIRDEKNKLANIVKVLHSYTPTETYEALYLFWLGIDTNDLERKQKLSENKKREENFQKRLRKESDLSSVQQRLNFVNDKIEELNQKKNLFIANEDYGKTIEALNKTKAMLNSVSSLLGRLEIRKELILESKTELEREYTQIDTAQIKLLYTKANSLIPKLHVTFEETIKFHNDLLSEKLRYITSELPELERSIHQAKMDHEYLQQQENTLKQEIEKSDFTEDIESIITELSKLSEKKGQLEEQKRLWESSIEHLKSLEAELEDINNGITSADELIQQRITVFNKYFSDFSNQLYNEYYLLSTNQTSKGYNLVVTNIEGNVGTGKKKGQIAAFDFAYIKFADSLDLNCLHFIMHDQLENIHGNQLQTIVKVAHELNLQYVVPILRDKVPDDIDINKYQVVSLSQTDKLFRI